MAGGSGRAADAPAAIKWPGVAKRPTFVVVDVDKKRVWRHFRRCTGEPFSSYTCSVFYKQALLCAILHIIYSFKRICAIVKQSCATKAVDFVGAAVEFLPQSECSRRLTKGKGKQFEKFI